MEKESMIGRRIGRLVVIERADNKNTGQKRWRCLCDCGTEKVIDSYSLTRKHASKSCGCLCRELSSQRLMGNQFWLKHGESAVGRITTEYRTWQNMRRRCDSPKDKHYHNYGGRGIRVCSRWLTYENFLADMGRKPTPSHSIDRYPDTNGNYEPTNCRWATPSQQTFNQRPRKRIEDYTIQELINEIFRRNP